MLDSLFNPAGVAVIGASGKALHIGNRVIKNLLDFGYQGGIYPINPKADEIRGVKAYKSILDVPGQVDVAHMVIPAKFVPMAVEDCGKKGVKHIIINSGGFSETGPQGAEIEKAFLEKAREYGIRIFGPNCQGIINADPAVKAYCNFTFTFPEAGHISIVALSGGVAEVIHQGFSAMDVGTRIYASNGNACDISIPEIIRYLADDDGTRVIVTYVEGLKDPMGFFEAAREATAKKPVLAMKAGRTLEGAQAAASHTGGLAREDLATDLIFKKAGIVDFRDEGHLINAAVAFGSQPIPAGNRVGIITNTGGPAVIATDVLVDAGLTLPPLSENTKALLTEKLYPEASVSNPVDVLATGTAEHYLACLEAMMADDSFDCILVNFVTPFFVNTEDIAAAIARVNMQQIKPMVCNLMTDRRQWAETEAILKAGGVPCFALPSDAARALGALVRYRRILDRPSGRIRSFADVDTEGARAIFNQARGGGLLAADQVYGILEAYGIDVPQWQMADGMDGVIAAADRIGYPVVVKADAASVVHKSDMGGVAVNLPDAQAVHKAVTTMKEAIDAADLRFFVQQFVPGGREVILGAKAEPGMGHLIMFGLGGIFVEVLKDVVFNLTPVTDADAREMVNGIRGAALLSGVRGEKPVDKTALIDLIQRLSRLTTDFPQIRELDLNPVMAFENGAVAVDARIAL
ncbi:acyl-CoA synthetase [Desulfosarcina alkanivorans]|uniref:Acyl-CoA synthetase n=1 Tax=Desulfosarcina alkanivorans TaxID=571177 RepID=A0A5K7YHS5_9BACT|nr:acetate--CoA ligase family protein [Desulfosarcina alkanivorans]BBO67419.1 acyl-CoA synthetase [Desulfosarcina alkanivorans]